MVRLLDIDNIGSRTITANGGSFTVVDSAANLQSVDLSAATGVTVKLTSGNADLTSITLDSETKLASAVIDSGQMKLTKNDLIRLDHTLCRKKITAYGKIGWKKIYRK